MRAIVIGGSGQIGSWLLRWLTERGHEALGTYANFSLPGLVRLDANELEGSAAWLRAQRAEVVFYPAGFTYVDGCQRDPRRAWAANVEQPLNLARAAADSGARFVFFSTDYVFDGQAGPYAEHDPTGPICVYGQTKLDAEHALTKALGYAQLTIRTSWVYGPEYQGKNFAYTLARTLREGRSLVCSSDQRSSPTYGPDVALAAVRLVEERRAGLVHVAGPQVIDRVQFARALAEAFALDPNLIVGRPTHETGPETPRPLRSGLLTRQLDRWLPGVMHPLSQTLKDFKDRLSDSGDWANPLARGTESARG